ncbi:MAG: ABC transporter permease [Dehalobacterium sp.]
MNKRSILVNRHPILNNKRVKTGLMLLIFIVVFCFLGPFLSPYELGETNLLHAGQPPSIEHWLGTDKAGRDVLLRLMIGGRLSLIVGFAVVAVEIFLGTVIGLVSGYYGGWIDNMLMRFVDVVFSIPFLPVLLLASAVMSELQVSPDQRIYLMMLIIGMFSWPYIARLVRGQAMTVIEQEFILAAQALGASDSRRIFRHLLPNIIPQVIVAGTLGMAGAIMTETVLSYLGLGILPPFPSWGNMVQAVNDFNDFRYRMWLWLPPGGAIFLTVISVNLIGDGLRDLFDPREKTEFCTDQPFKRGENI